MSYQLICMSFDGEYKREEPIFDEIEKAYDYDIGSKWFFYPFHLIVENDTIKDAPFPLDCLIGDNLQATRQLFYKLSRRKRAKGMDSEKFCLFCGGKL